MKSKDKFITYIKKYKNVLIGVFACVAVLTAAFLAGGNLNYDSTAVLPSSTNKTSASSALEATGEIEQTSLSASGEKEDSTDGKTTDKQTSGLEATEGEKSESGDTNNNSASGNGRGSAQASQTERLSGDEKSEKSEQSESKGKSEKAASAAKPKPVTPQQQTTGTCELSCTISISCSTILDNMSRLDSDKTELVPSDGWILKPVKVSFTEGESVYDITLRTCRENNIHIESSFTPLYNSAYVEGIGNLYEFDCGALSGWMYGVNGWYPNYGFSQYVPENGDCIEWKYTCDLGNDIGANI